MLLDPITCQHVGTNRRISSQPMTTEILGLRIQPLCDAWLGAARQRRRGHRTLPTRGAGSRLAAECGVRRGGGRLAAAA